MNNEQAIRRLEDLQRLYLGNEKFTADIEAIDIAIEALRKSDPADILHKIYMEGVNMSGEYRGCWVRYRDIERIIRGVWEQ